MTAYPAWTPASRPGIIPLHPLGFGTILGRSFVALRQNPRVLLGFALVVQTLAYLLVVVAIAAVAVAAFMRLDTLRPGTEEFDTVLAGSIAITAIAGIVLGLAAGALGVIVQGIVVSEVAHAAVAEKLTLGGLWQQVKPVAWRLIGYAFLLVLAVLIGIGVVVLGVVGVGTAAPAAAVGLTVLLVLLAIPLLWWLSIKLLLTPAVIILEHATIGQAIARSWTLVRGRFWVALGVILVISFTFSAVAQVISIPFTFLSTGLTTIIAPTGAPEPSAIIGVIVVLLLTQIVTLLIQAVAVVVQSTATALIYIDCRMRREGLDLDLLTYVERRDAGATSLPDPYREHIGRVIAPRFPIGYTPGYPQPAYPQAAYPQAGYSQPGYRQPAYQQPCLSAAERLGSALCDGSRSAGVSATARILAGASPCGGGRRSGRGCATIASDALGRARSCARGPRPRVAVGLIGGFGVLVQRAVDTGPPLTPDGEEARELAERELADPVYQAAEPTPIDRIARAIGEFFERLFNTELDGGWGSAFALIAAIVIVIVIVAAFVVWGIPRATRRAPARATALFGETETRSAAELRRAAASHAQNGEWDAAIILRFRALARGTVERGAVDTPPGATVHAFARAAARAFPSYAVELENAAAAFDDVRYLRLPGTPELYRLIAEVDDRVAASRPLALATAGAPV